MKEKIVLFLILIALIIFASGCEAGVDMAADPHDNDYFCVIYDAGQYVIMYNKQTNVMYTMSQSTKSTGVLTVLLNADGTPMLYEEKKD